MSPGGVVHDGDLGRHGGQRDGGGRKRGRRGSRSVQMGYDVCVKSADEVWCAVMSAQVSGGRHQLLRRCGSAGFRPTPNRCEAQLWPGQTEPVQGRGNGHHPSPFAGAHALRQRRPRRASVVVRTLRLPPGLLRLTAPWPRSPRPGHRGAAYQQRRHSRSWPAVSLAKQRTRPRSRCPPPLPRHKGKHRFRLQRAARCWCARRHHGVCVQASHSGGRCAAGDDTRRGGRRGRPQARLHTQTSPTERSRTALRTTSGRHCRRCRHSRHVTLAFDGQLPHLTLAPSHRPAHSPSLSSPSVWCGLLASVHRCAPPRCRTL